MQTENAHTGSFEITQAQAADIKAIEAFADSFRHNSEADYYIRQFEYQEKGQRILFLLRQGEHILAYAVLNFSPKYALFKKLEIPEIQDLIVHPHARRKGYGRALIAHIEGFLAEKGYAYCGIGVSVSPLFGPAQQLYMRLGYVPDGCGVSYDRQQIGQGEFRPVDSQLCLMMVKTL